MIRLIQNKLIIPCGDTGSFSIPAASFDAAIFTIFDPLTKTKIFEKILNIENEALNISFTHNETINLKPGKYVWDIKTYKNPQYNEDNELIDADEVNSYYACYTLPECEVRETRDGMG